MSKNGWIPLNARVIASASVVGNRERHGPIGECFDMSDPTDKFGQKTWEMAESEMQRRALNLAIKKGEVKESDLGSFDLAAVTVREAFDSDKNEYSHSYLFCANSAEFFSNELLGKSSYANFDIVSALVENISRVDIYASLELGGTSLNSSSYGGKQMVETEMRVSDVQKLVFPHPTVCEVIKEAMFM